LAVQKACDRFELLHSNHRLSTSDGLGQLKHLIVAGALCLPAEHVAAVVVAAHLTEIGFCIAILESGVVLGSVWGHKKR
jgi:hypothetical protein